MRRNPRRLVHRSLQRAASHWLPSSYSCLSPCYIPDVAAIPTLCTSSTASATSHSIHVAYRRRKRHRLSLPLSLSRSRTRKGARHPCSSPPLSRTCCARDEEQSEQKGDMESLREHATLVQIRTSRPSVLYILKIAFLASRSHVIVSSSSFCVECIRFTFKEWEIHTLPHIQF